MSTLHLLPYQYLAARITTLLTVRIHTSLCEKGIRWARLWYLLRALDVHGSGFAKIDLEFVCQLLATSSSTIYQWLREGREAGAFRTYRITQRQGLRVALGSLHKVCQVTFPHFPEFGKEGNKGQSPWGVVAEVPLHMALSQLKTAATAATAQKLQQQSRYAAWASLPAAAQKIYRLPHPAEFFQRETPCNTVASSDTDTKASQSVDADEQQRLSHNLHRGSIRCLLHVGPKRIFVSKGFVPFGTSQEAIAGERGISERTVQRHVKALGVNHRQIVQAKAAYKYVQQAIDYDAPFCQPEENIQWQMRLDRFDGSGILTEPSGQVGKPHSFQVKPERFFSYGEKDWIYRCNLYEPALKLCTMHRSLVNYRRRHPSKTLPARGGQCACVEEVLEKEKILPPGR